MSMHMILEQFKGVKVFFRAFKLLQVSAKFVENLAKILESLPDELMPLNLILSIPNDYEQ